MPTQIPSGSALAVKHPQRRRRKVAGPKMLGRVKGYAEGGLVKATREILQPAIRKAYTAKESGDLDQIRAARRSTDEAIDRVYGMISRKQGAEKITEHMRKKYVDE